MNTAHVISLMLSTRRIVGKRVSSQTVRNALAVNPNITAEGIALSLLGR